MSEQSGGGPITREQVERAIAKPRNIDYRELPPGWRELAPDYVIAAEAADDWDAEHAALTRWRDELTAAEPVRRVARWDAELEAYALTPIHDDGALMTHAVEDAAKARDWGYEIEGGPERRAAEERLACAYRESDGTLVWDDSPLPEPERPAPRFKVVDVPQPRIVVKRCDEVEAEWTSADATILIVTHDALDDAIFVPIALLRAMLADIDAQQGGAS